MPNCKPQKRNPSLLMVDSAPYLEDGDVELEEFTELNHLMQPSPYRGHPTPEVEEAWIKLWRGELPGLRVAATRGSLIWLISGQCL